MTKASILLPVALLLGLAALAGACGKQDKTRQAANAAKPDGMEELFPAPPAKPGGGQKILNILVNNLYGGSYEKALNAARIVASRQSELAGPHNVAANVMRGALT